MGLRLMDGGSTACKVHSGAVSRCRLASSLFQYLLLPGDIPSIVVFTVCLSFREGAHKLSMNVVYLLKGCLQRSVKA